MSQTDERALILTARNMASAASSSAQVAANNAGAAATKANAAEQALQRGAIAWEADVTISYSSVLALNLAPRTATFAITGAKVGDRIYVHRKARPTLGGANLLAGVMIEGTGYVSADGTVEIYHVIPAIGIGQTLLIPLHLVAYRTATA